jgi:hypothetical protein
MSAQDGRTEAALSIYLRLYVGAWHNRASYGGSGRAAITLGMSSLLNHSYAPNATFIRQIDDCELELRSSQSISGGDEITIDYQMKLWFDPS